MRRPGVIAGVLVAVLAAGACGGKPAADNAAQPAASAAAASGPAAKPTGKVVVVTMTSDAVGNYFKPADFEVHRGDVIRFTLGVGVHNVRFVPDSNAGKKNLPPASDLLQLPGQTYDLAVNLEPGDYFYQCDAHLALGMKGHIHVDP